MTAGRVCCKLLTVLISTLLFSISCLYAQVSWEVSCDTGIRSKQPTEDDGIIYQANLDGHGKYNYTFGDMQSTIHLRLRPEFNDLNRNLRAFRYRVAAEFGQSWENVSAGLLMYSQRNSLFADYSTIKNDVLFFRMPIELFPEETLSWKIVPGYASQSIKIRDLKETETVYLDAAMAYTVLPELQWTVSGYCEKFLVRASNQNFGSGIANENSGYRYGVHTGMDYSDGFMAGVDYRLLLHNSDITKPVSVENSLHLFFGAMATENISILLLYDISRTNFRLHHGSNEALLYIPFEKENRIYVKTGFDITDSIELYLSYGYRKDNTTFDRTVFDGTSCVVGFTFSSD
ncbi:MAG: hypothetical protein HYV28_16775 [Ignavibacteriales bacterium]|nr:hypothetical protein [Ignavibacteriales bacterium]